MNDEQLREQILDIIAQEGLIDRAKLTADATIESLGIASVDVVMMLMSMEEKFGVYVSVDAELSGVRTLTELVDVLVAKLKAEDAKRSGGLT